MTRTSTTGRSSSSRQGFTFIELIAVLFIISLLMATVLPTIRSKRTPGAEAMKVASLLREMNDSAIARKAKYQVTFDLGAKRIDWDGPDGKGGMALKGLQSVTLPSRGEVKDGTLTVFFDPSGAPEDITVFLSDGGKSGYDVILEEISGRVRVEEVHGDKGQ